MKYSLLIYLLFSLFANANETSVIYEISPTSIADYSGRNSYNVSNLTTGKYQIPYIDPNKFEILQFKIHHKAALLSAGWTYSGNNPFSEAVVNHGLRLPSKEFAPLYTRYENKRTSGSISISSVRSTDFDSELSAIDLAFLHDPLDSARAVTFVVEANATGYSGAFGYVYWGSLTVEIKLRHLQPNSIPPQVFPAQSVYYRTNSTLPEGARLHPSVFEQNDVVLADNFVRLPVEWSGLVQKRPEARVWGFPNYRYKLMCGPTPGVGEIVDQRDGSDAQLDLTYDASVSFPTKAFFWVIEEPIPSS